MWPKTKLIDLLKITHPIIQAPMAGASTPELVAAVSNQEVWVPMAGQLPHQLTFVPLSGKFES